MSAEQQSIFAPSVPAPEKRVIAACQPNIVEVFPSRVAGQSFAPSSGCNRKEHDSFHSTKDGCGGHVYVPTCCDGHSTGGISASPSRCRSAQGDVVEHPLKSWAASGQFGQLAWHEPGFYRHHPLSLPPTTITTIYSYLVLPPNTSLYCLLACIAVVTLQQYRTTT